MRTPTSSSCYPSLRHPLNSVFGGSSHDVTVPPPNRPLYQHHRQSEMLTLTLRSSLGRQLPSAARAFSTTHPSLSPKVPSSSSASPVPPRSTDSYTQGHQPPGAPNLVAPFASESVDQLYAQRTPSPSSETPAFQGSSTSVDPPHPYTTSKLQHTGEEAVGSSAAVRHREPSWQDKKGGNYGTGLMDEHAVIKNKEGSRLPDVNEGPDAEQGRVGNAEAWKGRK